MSMKTLIKDLASIDRMLFVVGGGACVSEMYSDGQDGAAVSRQVGHD